MARRGILHGRATHTALNGPALAPGERRERVVRRDKVHGRIERRQLTRSDVLAGYRDWPGQQQVFEAERDVVHWRTGEIKQDRAYGVTSLGPERADAARLLELLRQHWHIEDRSHWVRDVNLV